MSPETRNRVITTGSIVALVLGFGLGIVLENRAVDSTAIALLDVIGRTWVVTLLVMVVPLSVSYLGYVVLSMMSTRVLGRLGARALVVHTAILCAGIVFSVSLGFATVEWLGDGLPSLSAMDTAVDRNAPEADAEAGLNGLLALVGQTQKVLGKVLLALILLTIIVAILVGRVFGSLAEQLLPLSRSLAENSLKWLQAHLLSLPLAVFALVLPMTVHTGFSAVSVAGIFVTVLSAMLLAFMLLIYLLVHLRGSVGLGRFAQGMVPSQVLAMSTRSSLATMPALMTAAESTFGVPKSVAAVIIPFFVSVFRVNRVISSPFKFIFLTYVYGLALDWTTLGFFLLVQIVVSFGSPGIPSGGKYINLPIYLAAGIPLEGYILLKAVDAIPDVFKTLLNVTETMGVTVVVTGTAKKL